MRSQQSIFLRQAATKLKLFPRSRFFSSDGSHDFTQAISEFNQEMESVFGERPPSSFSGSIDSPTLDHEPHLANNDPQPKEPPPRLTHVNTKGKAQLVDISSKEITKRVAVASCRVVLGRKVFNLVSANQMEKGDVLGVAKIAGVCGAKQTSSLIPLCHDINLSRIDVDLALDPRDFSVEIQGRAVSTGMTGVEMEALTAVCVAGLTVYDMCKAASKEIVITDVRLEEKSGGKSGDWSRKGMNLE